MAGTIPTAPADQVTQDGRPRSGPGLVGQYLPVLPLALFLLIALVGPHLGRDASTQDLLGRLQPPVTAGGTWEHPLGTDSLGRDVLARVLDAARRSLVIGLAAASLSALVGVSLGVISGMRHGWPDRLVTASVEVCLSVPTIVIGIVLTATLGQSLPNLLAILLVSGWIAYSRVLRLQVRGLVRSEFVIAAHAMGAEPGRVVVHHVLPNILPTIVILLMQQIAAVMIWEASLTFLGLGLPVSDISLGSLVREGQDHVFDAWWLGAAPGAVIALAVVGFNLTADWLQIRLDPVLGRRFSRRSRP